MTSILMVFLLTVLLSACGGNTKEEVGCTGKDWYTMGLSTAVEGKSVHSFDVYRDQCGDKLEGSAMKLYLDGYSKGIIGYCTYENGYELGVNSNDIHDVCPFEIREAYLNGYKRGARDLRESKHQWDRISDEEELSKTRDDSATHPPAPH
jgi:hypothetical protein